MLTSLPQTTLITLSLFGVFFSVALLLAMLLTPLSIPCAQWLGIIDQPDPRKVHRAPITRMGGLAILGAIAFAVLICERRTPFVQAYLLGLATISGVGLVDDKYALPPVMKLAGEIVTALIFVRMSGYVLTDLGDLLGTGAITLGGLSLPVTIFLMAGVMNSLNLSDGLDGLAGGITLNAGLFLLPLLHGAQAWDALGITVIMMGAVLGFLRYNSHPARLFMGDTGSLILGYSLSSIALALLHAQPGVPGLTPIAIFIPISFPAIDMMGVMGRRAFSGQWIFRPDRLHLHHRLLALGMPHSIVVAILYGGCFGLGILGWRISGLKEWQQFAWLIGALVVFYGGVYWLEGRGRELVRTFNQRVRRWRRQWTAMARPAIGGMVARVGVLFWLAIFAPLPFIRPFSAHWAYLSVAIAGIMATLYPWRGKKCRMNYAHASLFVGIFCLFLNYHFNDVTVVWLERYLTVLSLISALWVVLLLVVRTRYVLIFPSSFEVLLVVVSLVIPLVWGDGWLSQQSQYKILYSCLQSLAVFAAIKSILRRQAQRNAVTVCCLIGAHLCFGLSALL